METLISSTEHTQSDVLFWQWQWTYDPDGYIEWLNNKFEGQGSGHQGDEEQEDDYQGNDHKDNEKADDWTYDFEYGGQDEEPQRKEERQPEEYESTWLFANGIHGDSVETNFNIDLDLMKKHTPWINELSNNLGNSIEYSSETTTSKKLVTYRSQSTSMLSNDLPHLHPDQFGFLEDPELEDIFLLAFSERKLYQTGLKTKYVDIESTTETSSTKGPLIICLDTSYSMYWSNDIIPMDVGKMMIFELTLHAASENREVILIEFANNVRYFNITNIQEQYGEFLEFWRTVWSGGTDVEFAIEYAIDKVNEKGIQDADILAVSDMQIDYDQDFLDTVNMAKEKGMSLYGVNISDYIHQATAPQDAIFDHVFTLTSESDTGKLQKEIKSYFNA